MATFDGGFARLNSHSNGVIGGEQSMIRRLMESNDCGAPEATTRENKGRLTWVGGLNYDKSASAALRERPIRWWC
jgi:hypothetical protein